MQLQPMIFPTRRGQSARPRQRWFGASAPALASALLWTLLEGAALLRARLRRTA